MKTTNDQTLLSAQIPVELRQELRRLAKRHERSVSAEVRAALRPHLRLELGVFGTSVVNAVLVLILISILLVAVLAQRVADWIPHRIAGKGPLGRYVLVVTASAEPSEASVQAAALLAAPPASRRHPDRAFGDRRAPRHGGTARA